jgi:hypothetical protein
MANLSFSGVSMVRVFVVACAFSCLAASVWAQTQPAPGVEATQTAAPAKPAAKKPAAKAKASAKPPGPAESGPCQTGVIPVVGDEFVVQRVGLTMFGNEYTEVPIDAWGLDDLVVARVRAALPGTGVRRIAYPKGAFAPYDHPAPALFRNSHDDLTGIVRQITANAGCERYVVVTKFTGQVDGTNQTNRGVGVVNRGIGAGVLSHTSLFSNVHVTIFDGQTFAIRKRPFSLGAVLAGSLGGMTQDPLTKLENDAFPEPATAAAASATLRDHTRALLAAVLDKTLPASLKEE